MKGSMGSDRKNDPIQNKFNSVRPWFFQNISKNCAELLKQKKTRQTDGQTDKQADVQRETQVYIDSESHTELIGIIKNGSQVLPCVKYVP